MKNNREEGFTLFELIIVLVIVGLLSSLALPRLFNSMTHVELKTSTRHTIALLHKTRDIAYFQKKKVKASFNLETDQITISQYDNKKKESENSLTENDKIWSVISKYSYPEGVKIKLCKKKDEEISHDKFDVFFSPNGNSSGGIIILKNKKNRVYEIEVDLITGSARIIE